MGCCLLVCLQWASQMSWILEGLALHSSGQVFWALFLVLPFELPPVFPEWRGIYKDQGQHCKAEEKSPGFHRIWTISESYCICVLSFLDLFNYETPPNLWCSPHNIHVSFWSVRWWGMEELSISQSHVRSHIITALLPYHCCIITVAFLMIKKAFLEVEPTHLQRPKFKETRYSLTSHNFCKWAMNKEALDQSFKHPPCQSTKELFLV